MSSFQIQIPHIEKIYKFSEMPTAYDRCKLLHTRGKLVIDLAEEVIPPKIEAPPEPLKMSPYHPGTKSVPVIDLKPPKIRPETAPLVA